MPPSTHPDIRSWCGSVRRRTGTTVTVRNDGPPTPAPTPGAGLRGMRERAESLGGHLDAGPTDDGWLVEAVLP